MVKLQRLLLVVLALANPAPLLAQVDITIEVKGVSGVLAENVRLFLSIEQQKKHELFSEGRMHRLHKKATQEITLALQPFGYYKPTVKTELTQLGKHSWQASYTINPGPPLPVGGYEFTLSGEMNRDPFIQTELKSLHLQEGDVFDHSKYDAIKSALTKLAAERGYFDARFIRHIVEIDLDAYEARVTLAYDSGARYHFGSVTLKQDILNEELLRRYFPFEQEAPYELNALIDLQQAYNDSDYFHVVEVSPGDPKPDSLEVPITVTLTPRKPNIYSLGLGYGTDTGARAQFGWEKPRLNRSGHRLNTRLKIAEVGFSFTAQYRVSVLNPRTDQLIYSAGIVNQKTKASDSTVRTVGTSLNHSRGNWRESLALNFQQEEYTVADDSGVSNLLLPSINWSRIWGRRHIFTLDGLKLEFGFRGASQKVISNSDFIQFESRIKTIEPLGKRNRIILRGTLGSTLTNDFHKLPSTVRFFAGGAQSVRGYSYQSLGPKDENDKVIGGRQLLTGSVELEQSLNSKWGISVFYDVGNAFDKIGDREVLDVLEHGAGIALRWQSLIGPIRVALASAVSRESRPLRIHINIGPDF